MLIAGVGGLAAVALAVVVIANSALFEASDIQVRGSDHVEQQTVQALVDLSLIHIYRGPACGSVDGQGWLR